MSLEKLHKKYGGHCVYCGILTKLDYGPGEQHLKPTKDHLIPLSAGGRNGEKNIVLACFPCNRRKGAVDLRTLIYLWHERDPEGLDAFMARIKDSAAAIRETQAAATHQQALASRGVVAAFAAKAAFYTVGRYLT